MPAPAAAQPLHALAPGYALHEYRIESTLGVGGFGMTYLATDANLNLKVAIKEYLPDDFALRTDGQTVQPKSADMAEPFQWGKQRFMDEARTLASFRHPNIVRVMRFFEANQTAYMVMEFVSGSALPDWIKERRPLAENGVLGIARPLLEGLEVIHKTGYLHRDIKPGNIYMRDDGSPVLLDFGSARQAVTASELTAIVSPGYAPLEQYHSQGKQGPWSDLYAFGGVLYWVVTGRRPIEATARARQDMLPPAVQVADRSLYSANLLGAIDWALAPQEEKRPQNVPHFLSVLPGAKAGEDTTVLLAAAVVPAAGPAPAPAKPEAFSFDQDTLKRIEAELAKHIGPIAAVIVKSAAKKAYSLAELAKAVGGEISDDKVRSAFVRKISSGEDSRPVSKPASQPVSGGGVSGPGLTQLAAARFDAKTLERAEKRLAQHIGAIAKVVVKRAAARARDEGELYLLIADEIADKDERNTFIRKAISVSGKD